MPRIRKKTSKRISTHQRAKFKHKVAEGRKKKKKEAKKNPQWKSKKKKDPGIPNNFPYKEQILAEVAEARREGEEAKQRRKEEKRAAREGGVVEERAEGEDNVGLGLDEGVSGEGLEEGETRHGAPLLLNPELPNLGAVLEKADVVLLVLDARDPASYRLAHVEELVAAADRRATLVFVLNKIDLVPREALVAWAKHLRAQHATFLFRSATSFLPKAPLNDPKLKNKAKETTDGDATGRETLLEYLGQRAAAIQSDNLQVAVVGLTNSGKSAIVNSLAQQAIVPIYAPTSSTDAWKTTTTRAFEVPVEATGRKITLVDTPGVSLQADEGPGAALKARDMLLRSRGRIDKVRDPVPAVEDIVSRADTQDLMVHYNLPAFAQGDCAAFLAGVARATGLLKKRGEGDQTQAARAVLRDWTTGKLPFYTDAPKEDVGAGTAEGEGVLGVLGGLCGRGDEVALVGVRGGKEMRKAGGAVRVRRGEVEARRVVLDAPFVVEEAAGEEEGDGEGEEGGESEGDGEDGGDGGDGGDGESEDSEEEDQDKKPPTGKRKRQKAEAATSSARPAKKVAFTAETLDRNERRRQARSSAAAGAPKLAARRRHAVAAAAAAAATRRPTSKARTGTSKDTDAYDFDQFFKS